MINHEFLQDNGILIIKPEASLQSGDFDELSSLVDPYVADHGKLAGLVIHTESFPGWQNFASMLAHIKFVKEHHSSISKVAVVVDKGIVTALPALADRFVQARIKRFDYDDLDAAITWIKQD